MSAEQGHDLAQINLGYLYDLGQGVPQDYVLAYKWYNLAIMGTLTTGEREVREKERDRIASKMTPEQIAEAQKLAREWKPKKEK